MELRRIELATKSSNVASFGESYKRITINYLAGLFELAMSRNIFH